jgi:hypothetical protein
MKPAIDTMTRLHAADPARHAVIDETERARIWQLIAVTPGNGDGTEPSRVTPGHAIPPLATQHRARPRRATPRARLLRVALAVPALLVLAAGALAATGVIRVGAPAEPVKGFSAPLRSGGLVKGTVQLLPLTAPDPGGGPPWGMRVLSTRSGEGCVQVGRLLDGKLGAIGQDNAFGDDGLFHEFAEDSAFAKTACTLLDGNGRIFLNATVGDMPASAWVGFGGGCVPSTATSAERLGIHGKRLALCPQADERNLYYGLLGPYAESITYKLNGQTHTRTTTGPEGAYLLVTLASPKQLFNFNAGGTQDVVPVDGPITELHYRNGAICHITSRSWIGGREACSPPLQVPVGWTPPSAPVPTSAQLASPLRIKLLRDRRGGYEIALSFSSRVAIANARTTYRTMWREAGMGSGIYSGGPLTPSSPAAGQTVSARIGGLGRPLRAGVVSGEVMFMDATGPGNLEEGPGTVKRVVARFSVRVP